MEGTREGEKLKEILLCLRSDIGSTEEDGVCVLSVIILSSEVYPDRSTFGTVS